MFNQIIGLGNAGSQIVREIANNADFHNVKLYAIDSVASNVDIKTSIDIDYICTISDESQGSGRDRERGAAMYCMHESKGDFDQMYLNAMEAKSPVIVISSAAGGTGSGSIVPLCKKLVEDDIDVIPIIIYPNDADPTAYHLNATDLLIELGEINVSTYSIFVNPANTVDYTNINHEVVDLIEIILGMKYKYTKSDSIDDSDLNSILAVPGRFIAFSAKAPDAAHMKKELTRKLYSGYQPAWSDKEANTYTFVKAFSLVSMFATTDYDEVFSDIRSRIPNALDEYKNAVNDNNDGTMEATVIVAGLPRHNVKIIDSKFNEVDGIADGMKRSTRPKFMNRKKKTFTKSDAPTDNKEKLENIKWDD